MAKKPVQVKQPPVTVPWDLETYLQDGMTLMRVVDYEVDGNATSVVVENCYSGATETMLLVDAEKRFKIVRPRRAA